MSACLSTGWTLIKPAAPPIPRTLVCRGKQNRSRKRPLKVNPAGVRAWPLALYRSWWYWRSYVQRHSWHIGTDSFRGCAQKCAILRTRILSLKIQFDQKYNRLSWHLSFFFLLQKLLSWSAFWLSNFFARRKLKMIENLIFNCINNTRSWSL